MNHTCKVCGETKGAGDMLAQLVETQRLDSIIVQGLSERIDGLEAALQALADEFAIRAAKGIVPAINDAVLVEAIELLAALAPKEPTP